MTQKLKDLWDSGGRWFLIGLPIAAAVITAVAWSAHQSAQTAVRPIAQPPAEQEVTFDTDANRAYTSEDGIVVIQPSGKGGTGGCPTFGAGRRPRTGLDRNRPPLGGGL
ncbi:MAG: hypothetical protein V8T62_03180 [Oscillospiraceae bacterium]